MTQAVYDTCDGQRIGTLLLPNDQMSVDNLELKIADANSDRKNDIGVVSHNNNIIWFNFSPNKQYSEENPNGCFEAID